MLLVTFILHSLLFGGDIFSYDYVREAAKEVIKDKDRAKQVVAITKQADKEFKSFSKDVDNLSRQLVKINQDYYSTREEVYAIYAKSDKRRSAFMERLIELRFQAKNHITAEEWQTMYAKIRE